jgi:hypothetical protein
MRRLFLFIAFFLVNLPVGAQPADFFETRIRPLLSEHCFNCHGPAKQKSGLRLDSRDALLRGGDNGPAIKPDDPEQSLLVQAVRHSGDLKMPPKKKLKLEQIDALALWIKNGAAWPANRTIADADAWKRHWAFQPIRRPIVPGVRSQESGVSNPIDAFVAAKRQAAGLSGSPEADRRTLLRRLSFDLVGLPPTTEEVSAFESDCDPAAYEKQVERLLASLAYGERWGRHWLDVARYADTKGYVFFEEAVFPWAWTYRDYVIKAFNDDLPYDRFLLEQLAADRLDLGKDRQALRALGFLALGGRFMNNVHDILDDRIDVVTRGLLGLTVTCARCHDHKFDPIPTRDYYSLHGVFASSAEPSVPPLYFDPPRTPEYEKFVAELDSREQKLAAFLDGKRQALREGARKRVSEYLLAVHATKDVPDAQEFMLIAEGNDLNPSMIARWRAQLRRSVKTGEPVFALWHALSSLPEKGFAANAEAVIKKTAANPLVTKGFLTNPPKTIADTARLYADVLLDAEKKWQALRLVGRPAPDFFPDADLEQLRLAFHGLDAAANVLSGQMSELELLPDRASQGELQKFRNAVQQWRVSGAGAPPRATILVDLPRPIEPRVFIRGNPGNLGEPVPRQFLALLAGKERKQFHDGSGRLEMARAIIDPANPLTARVMVNRVWQQHFGRGLVTTPGDFGLRSEPPSHPELLDWLASEFIGEPGTKVPGNWSIKKLHRLIVTSSTYRQASLDREESRKADPENVHLWRFPRRQLDFEAMRDALLAVSGRLERGLGGKSVQDGFNGNRRTLYSHLDRLNVPGLLRTFDFPNPDATSPQRIDTIVPQQALFLMNSPFAQDCARRLVQRPEIASLKGIDERVQRLYRLLFGRTAVAHEIEAAREYLRDGAAMVTWERYVQALLLTNEFVFVD